MERSPRKSDTIIREFFAIVGAPRCGTTSLSAALGRHPEVCFSVPKEPHFFTFNKQIRGNPDIERDYLDVYFPNFRPEHKVIGEGSISYLFSPDAMRALRRYFPQAKLIAMVRNPMDMIYSYHSRMLFNLDEDVAGFAEAWALQEKRAEGREVPRRCRDPRLLQYAKIGRLGERVGEMFEIAGRENCHVVVYDDLVDDPDSTFGSVARFLGIRDDLEIEFPRKNPNKVYRYNWLQSLLTRPPTEMARVAMALEKRENGSTIKRWRKRLRKYNAIKTELKPLEEGSLRQTLRDTFADDIQTLSTLLDRDFSHWR